MEEKIITVGPITSINSLVYHLSSQFLEIRNDYMHGRRPKFSFDFSDIKSHSISLSALCSLLSLGKKLSDFVGYPIPVKMNWDPQVVSFLHDSHFISIAKKLNIYSFQSEFDGVIRFNNEYLNPNSRLLYFGDIKPIARTAATGDERVVFIDHMTVKAGIITIAGPTTTAQKFPSGVTATSINK